MQKYSTRILRKYAKNIHEKAMFAEICKSVPQICNSKRAEILVRKYMQNMQQRHEYVSLTKYASMKFICNMHKYAIRPPQPKAGRRFAAALILSVREQHPRSHHKGATVANATGSQSRVRTGDLRHPVLCLCQLKTSLTLLAKVPRHWAREAGPGLARFRRG